MKNFDRRYYQKFSTFTADLKAIMSKRDQMRPLMRGELIDAAFRERLMLTVTAVNDCRYCSYAHAKQALVAGIDQDEIKALLDGMMEGYPENELPALCYAQHWAETQGRTNPAAREQFTKNYDAKTVKAIEMALHTIQMGNLLGNTADYILYRLSFGRFGNGKTESV